MRHRTLRLSFLAVATLNACAALIACSADQSTSTSTSEARGEVSFELQAAPGVTLGTITYAIIGRGAFSKTGSFDVSQSSKIGALIGPLPAGNGYTITLSAASLEGTSSCAGSAPFDVVAHQITPVAIALTCHEGARTGSVMINGALNVCPNLDAVSANPAEVFVGSSIALSAAAHDSDAGPAALSYHWVAASGSLSDASAANTTFTCSNPGSVTLTVSVSDGDPLASCADSRTIAVQCSAAGGGAGGASGGGAANGGAAGAIGGGTGGAGGGAGTPSGGTSGTGPGGMGGSAGASGAATGGNSGAAGAATGGGSGSGGSAGATTGGTGGGGAGGAAGAGGASEHLVVYRVGDGSDSLANSGNAVFVDEYTTTGSRVRTIPMPLTVNGSNRRFIASGTATSEGLLTRSVDGRFLVLTGYDAPIPTASLAGTTGTAVPRIVGRIAADGTVDTSTQILDGASGNNPRSVASTDGNQLWFAGASGGVRFLNLGNTSATTTQLSTTVTNLRQVGIFGSQLYVSDSSGSAVRLGSVGSGAPTTSGQVISNIPGFPVSGSPYGFYFADLDATVAGLDVLYVASDDAAGLAKYSLVSGSWIANGTIGATADAYRGLTAIVNGGTVTLYATRKGGSGAAGGGELVSLVDASGYNGAFSGTPTLLVTAAANTAFRGVALAPKP